MEPRDIHAQHKEKSMRFIKENTIFGYKKWWKTISISFPKSSEAIHITFYTNLYRVHWQGEFTLAGSLFCTTCLWNHEKKAKIPFLVTQTRQNSTTKKIIFENFGGRLYNDSALIFDDKSLWKDLQPKAYFSLAFYA